MEDKKTIKELSTRLLALIDQTAKVGVEDGEEDLFLIKIETDDPGSLIGFHGRNLSSLQLILGLILFRQTGAWKRVIVDVNEYRREQTERLKAIAVNAAERVRVSKSPASLSPMTPYERRIIHMALTNFEDLETKSEGEGSERHVVIFPKSDSYVDFNELTQSASEEEEESV